MFRYISVLLLLCYLALQYLSPAKANLYIPPLVPVFYTWEEGKFYGTGYMVVTNGLIYRCKEEPAGYECSTTRPTIDEEGLEEIDPFLPWDIVGKTWRKEENYFRYRQVTLDANGNESIVYQCDQGKAGERRLVELCNRGIHYSPGKEIADSIWKSYEVQVQDKIVSHFTATSSDPKHYNMSDDRVDVIYNIGDVVLDGENDIIYTCKDAEYCNIRPEFQPIIGPFNEIAWTRSDSTYVPGKPYTTGDLVSIYAGINSRMFYQCGRSPFDELCALDLIDYAPGILSSKVWEKADIEPANGLCDISKTIWPNVYAYDRGCPLSYFDGPSETSLLPSMYNGVVVEVVKVVQVIGGQPVAYSEKETCVSDVEAARLNVNLWASPHYGFGYTRPDTIARREILAVIELGKSDQNGVNGRTLANLPARLEDIQVNHVIIFYDEMVDDHVLYTAVLDAVKEWSRAAPGVRKFTISGTTALTDRNIVTIDNSATTSWAPVFSGNHIHFSHRATFCPVTAPGQPTTSFEDGCNNPVHWDSITSQQYVDVGKPWWLAVTYKLAEKEGIIAVGAVFDDEGPYRDYGMLVKQLLDYDRTPSYDFALVRFEQGDQRRYDGFTCRLAQAFKVKVEGCEVLEGCSPVEPTTTTTTTTTTSG